MQQDETFVLNLGPQHPATHGVLRVKLTMDGEYIFDAEPVLGYIHRMHEKMAENRTYPQFMPNMGRMDYLSAMAFNHGYALVVERACGIEVPERAEYIRVITVELNRISCHLVWFGAFVLDLGGFTPLLYCFDDREQILDLLESVTGSRLTYCYFRFGGLYNDIDDEFITGTRAFIKRMRKELKMYAKLVTDNIILIKRLKDTASIDDDMCQRYGATGPVARGSGINYDVRKNEPYSVYPEFDFDIPVYDGGRLHGPLHGAHGRDGTVAAHHRAGPGQTARRTGQPEKETEDDQAAAGRLLCRGGDGPRHFRYPAGQRRRQKAYRLKLRSPTFSNLSLFDEACRGMLLADALAFMGSLDLVIPEIDR